MSLIYKVLQSAKQYKFINHLYRLSKFILEVKPFYLVQEGFIKEVESNVTPKIDLSRCEVGFLNPTDIKEISESPEVNETEKEMLNKLNDDWLCLGIKFDARIISYMWCNVRDCKSDDLSFPLKENEAYLTDARTFKAYRGKSLAPYLRIQLYRHLK